MRFFLFNKCKRKRGVINKKAERIYQVKLLILCLSSTVVLFSFKHSVYNGFKVWIFFSYYLTFDSAGRLETSMTLKPALLFLVGVHFFFYMETIDKTNSVWHKRNYNIHLFFSVEGFPCWRIKENKVSGDTNALCLHVYLVFKSIICLSNYINKIKR